MALRLKVAIAGATGNTGQSIVTALLAQPEQFEVFALVRPESINKPALLVFSERGATIKSADFSSPDALVSPLTGMDVVISCLTAAHQKEQLALIEASSQAGVKRYVPSFFGPVCPPRGAMKLRDSKEDMLDLIKLLKMPYTAIDIGWWYQLSLPRLPSGRIRTVAEASLNEIIGDGETPLAFTDNRDIGKFVARIIADPRTVNRLVFAYAEVCTQKQIFDTLERVSGEKIERKNFSKEDKDAIVADANSILAKDPTDASARMNAAMAEYKHSMAIRKDNTVECAKYLGYLDAREMYPDVEVKSLTAFMEELLEGKTGVN